MAILVKGFQMGVSCEFVAMAQTFSLVLAFSPTGWTFGKGKQKSTRRRWQHGTLIRYDVPYSEHNSFTELKEFVKLTSPETIIPSVNNDGPDSSNISSPSTSFQDDYEESTRSIDREAH